MDGEIRKIIERHRPAIAESRKRHRQEDDSRFLETGELFLLVDTLIPEPGRDAPISCTGLYLHGGLGRVAAQTVPAAAGSLRLMVDLVEEYESDQDCAEALLMILAAGVQIVRYRRNEAVDRFALLSAILREVGEESYLVTEDAHREDTGSHIRLDGNLPGLVREAAEGEDTSRVQELLRAGGAPARRQPPLYLMPTSTRPAVTALLALAGVPVLDPALFDPDDLAELAELVDRRLSEPALDPLSPQEVLQSDPRLLAIRRGSDETVLCLHNFSGDFVEFRDRRDRYRWPDEGVLRDVFSEDLVFPAGEGALFSLELQPREMLWLRFA